MRPAERLWNSPTLMTWASLVLRTGGMLITTPLLLRRFGAEEIAVWYFLATAAALQTVFELGFTPTFVRALAYALGASHASQAATLERLSVTMQAIYGHLAIALLAVLGVVGSLAAMRPISLMPDPSQGWMAWAVVLVATVLTFANLPYSAFLQGCDRIVLLRRIETLMALLSIVSSAIALLLGANLAVLAAVTYVWPVAGSELVRRQGVRLQPSFATSRSGRLDREVVRELWPSTWRSAVGNAMSSGVLQASALMYAQLGSAAQVASFLFSLRVLQLLVTASQAPFYSKLPRMARLYAAGDMAQQLALASRGMALSHAVYAAGVIVAGVVTDHAMIFVGSNITFIERPLWFLMGAAFFVERYGAMHIQLYSLSNHIIWHTANGVSGVIYLVSLYFLSGSLGLYAFPMAVLIAYAGFYSWYSAWHSYARFAMSFWRFETGTALAPAVALGTALVVVWL